MCVQVGNPLISDPEAGRLEVTDQRIAGPVGRSGRRRLLGNEAARTLTSEDVIRN